MVKIDVYLKADEIWTYSFTAGGECFEQAVERARPRINGQLCKVCDHGMFRPSDRSPGMVARSIVFMDGDGQKCNVQVVEGPGVRPVEI
jgi:hypothetical protein